MATFEVQRKYIGWETTIVEADNFDEAVEIAESEDSWSDATDAYLTTEDYWVENQDTEEIKTRLEGADWEGSI